MSLLSRLFRKAPEGDAYRVLIPGGLLGIGHLRAVAKAALALGDGNVGLGTRQDLVLRGIGPQEAQRLAPMIDPLQAFPIPRARPDGPPFNIVSSAAVLGFAPSRPWLTRGICQEILAALPPAPPIAIALADPSQRIVPCRGSRINFLAEPEENLWRLCLGGGAEGGSGGPSRRALHSRSIARAVSLLAPILAADPGASAEKLEAALVAAIPRELFEAAGEAEATPDPKPLAEGFHFLSESGAGNGAWLVLSGERVFPGTFLEEAAFLAASRQIHHASLAPGRRLLIPDLGGAAGIPHWRRLLVEHGMDVRDARTEIQTAPSPQAAAPKPESRDRKAIQCAECRTIYDPRHGDPTQGISAGTLAIDLPAHWHCPVCDAPAGTFLPAVA